MIKIVDGCLLDARDNNDIDYAIHCCNAQMTMGSGIAKQVKERYPIAYKHYIDSFTGYTTRDTMLGEVSCGDRIINLIGQRDFGYDGKRYLNYGAIVRGFNEIIEEWGYEGAVFGFPYLFGCDRAGGDWDIMMELIEFCFEGFEVKIYKLGD